MDGERPDPGHQSGMKNKKHMGLSVSLISDVSDPCLLPFDDKTPTPTLSGLLQSVANSTAVRSSASASSNPFDEHFKAAAAATSGGSIFVSQTSVEAGGSGTNSLNTPQIFPNLLETSTGNAVLPSSPPPLTTETTKPQKRLRPLIPKKQEDGQITLNIPQHHLVLDPPEAKRKHPPKQAPPRPSNGGGEDDDKKQELLERNRLAAQRSRIKKKKESREVKTDNEKLRLENRKLQAENTSLKEEVSRLKSVVTRLVSQQQHQQILPPHKIVTINPQPPTMLVLEHPQPKIVTRDLLSEATLAAQLQSDLVPVVEQPPSSGFVRVTADSVSVVNAQQLEVPQKKQEQAKFVMGKILKGPIDSTQHLADKNS